MKGYEVIDLLYTIKRKLDIPFGEIIVDDTFSIYECETDKEIGKYIFKIGTRELEQSRTAEFLIEDAMHPVIGLFHEVYGHGGQQHYEFQKDTSLSEILALNHYACHSSWNYYGFPEGKIEDQYFKQPHEIAAQYVGIFYAYQFLSKEYSERDANEMICSYVNGRIKINSEFIEGKKEYKKVQAVLEDMDETFRRSIFKHRNYEHSRENPDLLVAFSDLIQNQGLITRVEKCVNGLKQDHMMAAVYMKYKDVSGLLRRQPACRMIDFYSAFRIFQQPIKPKPDVSKITLQELVREDLRLTEKDLSFKKEQHLNNSL